MFSSTDCHRRGSARGLELGDKKLNATSDFVANRTHSIKALPGRIVKLPIEVALASKEGADVSTPHCDDNITGLNCIGGQDLGFLAGEVDTFYEHGFDDDGIDRVDWG